MASNWFPDSTATWLVIIVFYVWAASELFNTLAFRFSGQTNTTIQKDRGSYWIIILIVWGSFVVSIQARMLDLGAFHSDLQYLGIGLAALGIALREWAVLSLGRFFTVKVAIASNQTLIRRGPYRWVRHSAYSGSILTLVGFPLAMGTWVGALLVLALSLAAYLYRVRIEEQVLLHALGDEYRDYMRRTWRFFPGL